MRVPATIEIPGEIKLLGEGHDPPADGVAFRAEEGLPGPLFVDGVCVGELVCWPEFDSENVYESGKPEPVQVLVLATTLKVMLDLPARAES